MSDLSYVLFCMTDTRLINFSILNTVVFMLCTQAVVQGEFFSSSGPFDLYLVRLCLLYLLMRLNSLLPLVQKRCCKFFVFFFLIKYTRVS